MTIDPKSFYELYDVDPKWYSDEYNEYLEWLGDFDDKRVLSEPSNIFRPGTPENIKQKHYAWEYIRYGYIPYEGYVFPYDDEDAGIISRNNMQDSLPGEG